MNLEHSFLFSLNVGYIILLFGLHYREEISNRLLDKAVKKYSAFYIS